MPIRKVVSVIVEGPSDETALGSILSKLYNNDTTYIHVVHGDLTTKKDACPANIKTIVASTVRQYAANNHFSANVFREIVHIIDTDGAFISEKNIFLNEKTDGLLYSDTGIYTKDVAALTARNKQKRSNLALLSGCTSIWNIPYSVFYMSCNLDHALYGLQNSSNDEKENNAYAFAKKYKNDIDGFLSYVSKSDFSVSGTYKDTWEYIQKGINSLQRHTNLGICFRKDEIGTKSK